MNDEVRGAKPAQPLVATALDFTRRRGAICRVADLFLQRSGPYGSIWVCLDRAADGSAPVQRGLSGPFESLWESLARSRRLMWIRWIDTINPRAPVAALLRRFDQHFELTTPRTPVPVHDAVDRPASGCAFHLSIYRSSHLILARWLLASVTDVRTRLLNRVWRCRRLPLSGWSSKYLQWRQ